MPVEGAAMGVEGEAPALVQFEQAIAVGCLRDVPDTALPAVVELQLVDEPACRGDNIAE